jgi:hypothetical protein
MDTKLRLIAILSSGVLLVVLLELVRRRRLLERYALLWLFSAAVLLALSLWSGMLGWLATDVLGIKYAPNALFAVAFGFVLVLLLNFSLAVSRLSDQSKVLAQRLALLDERLRRQEQSAAEQAPEADSEHAAARMRSASRH